MAALSLPAIESYVGSVRTVGIVEHPPGALGEHLCWAFDGEGEFVAAAVDYLREGIARGEQALFVADMAGDQQLRHALAPLGDIDGVIAEERLLVTSFGASYRRAELFDPDEQVGRYRRLTESALSSGFRGFRLAADATALVRDERARHRFLAYELAVDGLMAELPMSAMCAYDATMLGRGVSELAAVHPCRHGPFDPGFCLSHAHGTLQLAGEVDAANLDLFELALLPATSALGAELRIDLSALGFIDARALVHLDRVAADLTARGRKLHLLHAARTVRRCAAVLDLADLLAAIEAPA